MSCYDLAGWTHVGRQIRRSSDRCRIMAEQYEAPDPGFAARVHQTNAESDQQTARLENASLEELRHVVRDRKESTIARATALLGLMQARDPELNDLILELFDDPDPQLWRMVISDTSRNDARIRSKLLTLLDDSDEHNWSGAAFGLARRGEEVILPRLIGWLNSQSPSHSHVAVECLKFLKIPSAIAALRDFWTSQAGDEELRLVVAAALLDLGNPCGRQLLQSVAQHADSGLSVFSATTIFGTSPREGLNLMLQILDHGSLEAQQAMVGQIWSFARLPHTFTADGLAEARLWVTEQLSKL